MSKYVFKPYSELFPQLFEQEKKRISAEIAYLYPSVIIEHIGSTPVAGLGGKGIIDILIIIEKELFGEMSKKLEKLGYLLKPKWSTAERWFFVVDLLDEEEVFRRYHLHLSFAESGDCNNLLGFRDDLRMYPDVVAEYEELKRYAAKEAHQDGQLYRDIKGPFIQKILKRRD